LSSPSVALNTRPAWPWVVGVSAAVTAFIVYLDLEFALRPVVVLWFLLVCPGMALVRPLRLGDRGSELAIAIALSLALDTLVAGAMVYAGVADFEAMFTVLLAITLVAVAADVVLRSPPAPLDRP
jgi:hypothetical protein